MRLEDKVAIVTGAGQGIGREYAKTLANEGAKVVVAEINPDTGQQVSEEINELGGVATYLPLDLAQEQSCLDLAAVVVDRFGGIDILVNNGAIYHSMRTDTFSTVDLDYFEHFMAVNMTGQMLMTRAVVPSMRERGGGKIIFQSSGAAYVAGSSPYVLSKLAVVGLTRGFASELGPDNINVNCIAPALSTPSPPASPSTPRYSTTSSPACPCAASAPPKTSRAPSSSSLPATATS